MTSPKLPESAGWMEDPKRGAALGRVARGAKTEDGIKFNLQHVRLNSGGYDSGGAYWGVGQRLYWACSEDGAIDRYFRAYDREAAKQKLRADFPNARFFN